MPTFRPAPFGTGEVFVVLTGCDSLVLWRRNCSVGCLRSWVGTALLVLFSVGSVVAALRLGHGVLDYPGLGMIALAFGLVIAIAISGFGTTSGAHINPAVTISLAAVRRFPWREVPAYVAAQPVGGVLGAVLIGGRGRRGRLRADRPTGPGGTRRGATGCRRPDPRSPDRRRPYRWK